MKIMFSFENIQSELLKVTKKKSTKKVQEETFKLFQLALIWDCIPHNTDKFFKEGVSSEIPTQVASYSLELDGENVVIKCKERLQKVENYLAPMTVELQCTLPFDGVEKSRTYRKSYSNALEFENDKLPGYTTNLKMCVADREENVLSSSQSDLLQHLLKKIREEITPEEKEKMLTYDRIRNKMSELAAKMKDTAEDPSTSHCHQIAKWRELALIWDTLQYGGSTFFQPESTKKGKTELPPVSYTLTFDPTDQVQDEVKIQDKYFHKLHQEYFKPLTIQLECIVNTGEGTTTVHLERYYSTAPTLQENPRLDFPHVAEIIGQSSRELKNGFECIATCKKELYTHLCAEADKNEDERKLFTYRRIKRHLSASMDEVDKVNAKLSSVPTPKVKAQVTEWQELALIWDTIGYGEFQFFDDDGGEKTESKTTASYTMEFTDSNIDIRRTRENQKLKAYFGRVEIKLEFVRTIHDVETSVTLPPLSKAFSADRKFRIEGMKTCKELEKFVKEQTARHTFSVIGACSEELSEHVRTELLPKIRYNAKEAEKGSASELKKVKEYKKKEAEAIRDTRSGRPKVSIKNFDSLSKKQIYEMEDLIKEGDLDKMKKHLRKCADFYYTFWGLSCKLNAFLRVSCEFYDNLIFLAGLDDSQKPGTKYAAHSKCKHANLCKNRQHKFTDDRRSPSQTYYMNANKTRQHICETSGIIYMITCTEESCRGRYVGKTTDKLKVRYQNETAYSGKVKSHFHFEKSKESSNEERDCKKSQMCFSILQVVDEGKLFPEQQSFLKYVKNKPVELEGTENLWIKRLTDRTIDWNTQENFEYKDHHLERMAGLFRNFYVEHEVVYIPKLDTQPSTKPG